MWYLLCLVTQGSLCPCQGKKDKERGNGAGISPRSEGGCAIATTQHLLLSLGAITQ